MSSEHGSNGNNYNSYHPPSTSIQLPYSQETDKSVWPLPGAVPNPETFLNLNPARSGLPMPYPMPFFNQHNYPNSLPASSSGHDGHYPTTSDASSFLHQLQRSDKMEDPLMKYTKMLPRGSTDDDDQPGTSGMNDDRAVKDEYLESMFSDGCFQGKSFDEFEKAGSTTSGSGTEDKRDRIRMLNTERSRERRHRQKEALAKVLYHSQFGSVKQECDDAASPLLEALASFDVPTMVPPPFAGPAGFPMATPYGPASVEKEDLEMAGRVLHQRNVEAARQRKKRLLEDEETKARRRKLNAERTRQRRAQMDEETKKLVRQRETERVRMRRAMMDPEKKRALRQREAERVRLKRAEARCQKTDEVSMFDMGQSSKGPNTDPHEIHIPSVDPVLATLHGFIEQSQGKYICDSLL